MLMLYRHLQPADRFGRPHCVAPVALARQDPGRARLQTLWSYYVRVQPMRSQRRPIADQSPIRHRIGDPRRDPRLIHHEGVAKTDCSGFDRVQVPSGARDLRRLADRRSRCRRNGWPGGPNVAPGGHRCSCGSSTSLCRSPFLCSPAAELGNPLAARPLRA